MAAIWNESPDLNLHYTRDHHSIDKSLLCELVVYSRFHCLQVFCQKVKWGSTGGEPFTQAFLLWWSEHQGSPYCPMISPASTIVVGCLQQTWSTATMSIVNFEWALICFTDGIICALICWGVTVVVMVMVTMRIIMMDWLDLLEAEWWRLIAQTRLVCKVKTSWYWVEVAVEHDRWWFWSIHANTHYIIDSADHDGSLNFVNYDIGFSMRFNVWQSQSLSNEKVKQLITLIKLSD